MIRWQPGRHPFPDPAGRPRRFRSLPRRARRARNPTCAQPKSPGLALEVRGQVFPRPPASSCRHHTASLSGSNSFLPGLRLGKLSAACLLRPSLFNLANPHCRCLCPSIVSHKGTETRRFENGKARPPSPCPPCLRESQMPSFLLGFWIALKTFACFATLARAGLLCWLGQESRAETQRRGGGRCRQDQDAGENRAGRFKEWLSSARLRCRARLLRVQKCQ